MDWMEALGTWEDSGNCPLSGISIPADSAGLLGVKWGFWDNPWAEQGSLDRREGRKVFRFFVSKESIKHCSPIHLPLFLKGKKDFWRIYGLYSRPIILYISKAQRVSGVNEPLYLRVDSFFRKGPRRDRSSDRVQPPSDRAPSSDAIHRCCYPWNSEVLQYPATGFASRDCCRCHPQRLFHSQGKMPSGFLLTFLLSEFVQEFICLSCFAGNLHHPFTDLSSERWVTVGETRHVLPWALPWCQWEICEERCFHAFFSRCFLFYICTEHTAKVFLCISFFIFPHPF